MSQEPNATVAAPADARHTRWVKCTHWIITLSFLLLAFTGFTILRAHPRLYWGEVGNDLTPALFEFPISKNYKHGGWTNSIPFFTEAGSLVSASRTFNIFNQNSWGRSLHFLAAWLLVIPGVAYLLPGILTGHFRRHLVPQGAEFCRSLLWKDTLDHFRLRVRAPTGGPQYGPLQKCAYFVVVFLALPLTVITGLAMSPAITAAFPFLCGMFGGFQSARTLHFFLSIFLGLFLLVHVLMVIKSGFKRQMRAMTIGE